MRRPSIRLSRTARYTARYHVPAAALEGVVAGVFLLNDVVMRKTFAASAVLVTLLVMATPVSQLLATVWGTLMDGRPKRGFILLMGAGGRLALLAVAFAHTPISFALPIIVAITMANALIPALNALYQSNYSNAERGRVYGWVLSITAATTILASMTAGAVMDAAPWAYRIIYPVAGVIGVGSAYHYYRIHQRRVPGRAHHFRPARVVGDTDSPLAVAADWLRDIRRALRNPFAGSVSLFRSDPAFLQFEVAFMTYGIAWMMLQPAIPLFLVDEIHVSYAQAALARGPIFWGMITILSPLLGRLLDRWNAVRIGVIGFTTYALFPLALAASHSIWGVYGAFVVYGASAAAAMLSWAMGPILFAGRRDAATYMGVHVTMVGIRGLIGNPLGLLVYEAAGSRVTFLIASTLFAASAVLMARLDARLRATATAVTA